MVREKYGEITQNPPQGYADDHQVYKTFKPCDQVNVLGIQIVNCARTIQHWMVEYCLQLNPGKT